MTCICCWYDFNDFIWYWYAFYMFFLWCWYDFNLLL